VQQGGRAKYALFAAADGETAANGFAAFEKTGLLRGCKTIQNKKGFRRSTRNLFCLQG